MGYRRGAARGVQAAKVDVAIYTPGSGAGIPLNVLGSLQAPQTDDQEVIADEIDGYVTSLLSVVGIDADPLSSREHILASNIIAAAWAAGENIDLPTLLARCSNPHAQARRVRNRRVLRAEGPTGVRHETQRRARRPGFASWITGQPSIST